MEASPKSDDDREALSAVLYASRDIRMEMRKIPPPAADQVQIRMRATGLCGSDLHFYSHVSSGVYNFQSPFILGHEAAGEVVAIGNEVSTLQVGDRVAMEPGVPCGKCFDCRSGRYNICSTLRFFSSMKSHPHVDGTLRTLLNHPAQWCYKIPDHVSFEEAALLEPLSVALHAMRRCRLLPQESVLVLGAGAIGLLVCAMAKIYGASTVVVADIEPRRLAFAKKYGFCTETFRLEKRTPSANFKEELAHIQDSSNQLKHHIFTATFECTGQSSCVQLGMSATHAGGRLILIGLGSPIQKLDVTPICQKEIDILGVFRYVNTYPSVIDLVARGSIPNIKELITHRFSLEESSEAFETVIRGHKDGVNAIKVMVVEE